MRIEVLKQTYLTIASDSINMLMAMKHAEYLFLKFMSISYHTHKSLLIEESQ
jgi:hypothetical protein